MKLRLALLVLLPSLCALAQQPVIRAHLEPASNIMVGQPVRLVVSVFVPNYFAGAPEFPEFEIDNAIVVLPQDRAENSNTQIGGNTYAGITQTYVIYPQQAGDFHVPTAKLSVPYAIAPPKSTTAEVALPPLSFHADVPAAARDLPYFLPTTQLTMTERWSRPLKGLRTGDTVDRTITVTASKMQAMLIPPLELEQPDGIRIYNGEPIVRDQKTPRGDFISGQRVQAGKYFIEKPGNYTLPPIELRWWNLTTRRLVTAVVPATKFAAVENPDYKAELPPPPEPVPAAPAQRVNPWPRYRMLARRGLEGLLVIALLLMLVRLARQAWPHVTAWQERRRDSESANFRSLVHAAQSNDAPRTYARLLRWAAVAYPGTALDDVVNAAPDSALQREVEALAAAVYSAGTSSWNGASLATELGRLRQTHGTQHHRSDRTHGLQRLNPEAPRIGRS